MTVGIQFKRLDSSNRRTADLSINEVGENLQNDDSTPIDVTAPAEIRGYELYNPNGYPVWLKIFNGAIANITVSSATPDERYELQPGLNHRLPGHPITIHSPRVSFAVTREFAAGATSPGSAITGHVIYGTAS